MSQKQKPAILVVEDDSDLCHAIVDALNREGYSAMGVANVREASFKLKNQVYGCILLDLKLGTDSGVAVAEAARTHKNSLNVQTPIVVISGYLEKGIILDLKTKVQGALVKPFEMDQLLKIVKRHSKARLI